MSKKKKGNWSLWKFIEFFTAEEYRSRVGGEANCVITYSPDWRKQALRVPVTHMVENTKW